MLKPTVLNNQTACPFTNISLSNRITLDSSIYRNYLTIVLSFKYFKTYTANRTLLDIPSF